MNYATQHHIGHDQDSPTAEAAAVTHAVRSVRSHDEKTQGRQRNAKRQTKARAGSHASDGFLKASFLPKLEVSESLESSTVKGKIEKDFYESLSQLAEHYGIELMQTRQYGYPYNVGLAFWDAEGRLENMGGNWSDLQLVQEGDKTFLVTKECYRTASTLYYIPVMPLFVMLHDSKRKRTAHLLLSVCSYLYHIADIPYYRQQTSYLFWQYEMLKDWVSEDENTDETEACLVELGQATWIGERIEQKIFNRSNLEMFENRLKVFTPFDDFDRACMQCARNAFEVYSNYASTGIFRNAPPGEEADNDDDDWGSLCMDKCISFMASSEGWLYETLLESVNQELNEYSKVDEPTIVKRFDGSELTRSDFDFECRLFTLLDELCDLLNNYKTSRR